MSAEPQRKALPIDLREVGIVAIGRNEGARLRRCFDALPDEVRRVVYVDSASTDGSIEHARGRGFEVLELDMSLPFTAARARNAGLRRLRARWPELRYVQFIDGDCTLAPGWMHAGVLEMEANSKLAVVCGRRREVYPRASIYNLLCDMEWNTPVGDAESCGGDALARVDAVLDEGGYDERVISGEEPELCARLRARDWTIRRIDCEMTLHDAAMTSFGQWWRRAVRSGHGFAQVGAIHPALYAREKRSCVRWGVLLPAAILLSAPITGGLGLALFLAYPVLAARIFFRRQRLGDGVTDAALYAAFCVLAKFPEALGIAKYAWNRMRGRRSKLIEYK
jgi:GT2 family glycosyltransferase